MEMKHESIDQIILELRLLVEQVKKRESTQGVYTFTTYADKIEGESNFILRDKILREMLNELSSMSRFADFPKKEEAIFLNILDLTEKALKK